MALICNLLRDWKYFFVLKIQKIFLMKSGKLQGLKLTQLTQRLTESFMRSFFPVVFDFYQAALNIHIRFGVGLVLVFKIKIKDAGNIKVHDRSSSNFNKGCLNFCRLLSK